MKEQLSSFQKSSDEAHDNIRQNIKDIENELDKNRREHEQFNQDINANKVNYIYLHIYCISTRSSLSISIKECDIKLTYFQAQISKNMDLTNNEIDNINERHTKLRQEHEKLKSEVETQNKYNADNQVKYFPLSSNIF